MSGGGAGPRGYVAVGRLCRAVDDDQARGGLPGRHRSPQRGEVGVRRRVGEAEVVAADDRAAPGRGRGLGRRLRRSPGEAVQGVTGRAGRGARTAVPPAGRHRPHAETVDGEDGCAARVGHPQRELVGACRCDPDAQPGGAGGVRAHVAERERQAYRRCVLRVELVDRVERGVEQRRVGDVRTGVAVLCGGGPYVGEQFIAVSPRAVDAAEGRSVPVALLGQAGVQPGDVDLGGVGRRAGRGGVGRFGGRRGGERAGGVPDPRVLVGGTRVDRQRSSAVRVGDADRDLDVDAPVGGEEERGLQSELLDPVAAGPGPGGEGQFEGSGRGQRRGAGDVVVGQPGVDAQRQAAREQEFSGGRLDRGGQ